LVLSPARPLWPANSLLAKVDATKSRLLAKAKTVYAVQRQRYDAFAPVRKLLPADLKVLGVIISDDPETSLWRPFNCRRVEHVTATDSLQELHARGIEYMLVSAAVIKRAFQQPIEVWVAGMNGEIEARLSLELRGSGPNDWLLIRIHPNGKQ